MLFSRTDPHVPSGYANAAPSRAGIIGTVAVHALLVGGYLLIPAEVIERYTPSIIIGTNVPLTPPPPQVPLERKAESKPLQKSIDSPYVPEPNVNLDTSGETILGSNFPTNLDPGIIEPFNPGVIEPARDPVLTAVSIDPRYMRDFQPDYPPSMQRAQEEGKVTVRVIIGADGHVVSVEKLFATLDAFWEAARTQALRKWRFRAATRDGVAIESEKVMTVHFKLS
ncbi:MAG: energy transducer TonB [Sphingobium sp.]|uniref:energy transducer TonB n=1 Tax=Sphingobium sp. TaxID=1912891 RepID=UPI0029B1E84B|nr:energy transducer TonB [Sphingobium sp.]MDX3908310.1 energy transducer TonB [Sphingobium sp.]